MHDIPLRPLALDPAAAPFGEAAALLRTHDWGATPLGPREQWPAALRAAVDVALGSRMPMCVFWGPELIQIYNDSFIPILGRKHPAQGVPAHQVWSEVWDFVAAGVEQVQRTGFPTWSEDVRFLLEGGERTEERFFTVSYGPVRDEAEHIGGIFVTAAETTEHVLAQRREQVLAELGAAAGNGAEDDALSAALQRVVGADLAWVAVFEPDASGGLQLLAEQGVAPAGVAALEGESHAALMRVLAGGGQAVLGGAATAATLCGAGGPVGVLVTAPAPFLRRDRALSSFIARVARALGEVLQRAGRLRRVEHERDAVLERMTDGFLALDRDGVVTYLNPVAERLGERVGGQLRGRVLWDVAPGLRDTPFYLAFAEAMREQRAAVYRGRLPLGGEWMEAHVYPSPEGVSVFFRDAGEEVRLEAVRAELLERERVARADAEGAEQRLRDLVQGLDAIVWEAETAPFRFTFVSEQAYALTGYPVENWLRDPEFWSSLMHPDDRARVLATCDAATQAGHVQSLDYRVRHADGRTLWVRDTVRTTRGADGSTQMRGVVMDITHQRAADDAMRRLAAIVDSTDDAVIAKGFDGTILSWNPAAERIFGWSESEAVGHSIFDLLLPGGEVQERELLARVASGERVVRMECERPRKDGRRVLVALTLSPILEADGSVRSTAAVLRDITEERRLQAQLRQAQKMEAVGRLAGGVAHDFNNLLTAIKGNAGLLLNDLPPASAFRDEVLEIDRAAQRASDLTRQLLAFSRRQVLQPRVVDLNAVIGETRRMLSRLIGEHVSIEVNLASRLSRVKADTGQLEQVLLNLAVNARDAMPSGGRLEISTSEVSVAASQPSPWPYYVQPGDYVQLEVRDNGVGMEPLVLQHLFEPFFTTKPAGKGTGLGLSTVYGIVKQSGGYVWAESELGRGSRFVVLLPCVGEQEAEGGDVAPAQAPGAGAGITVLLVEDEAAVRSLTRRVLARAGYRVLEAADGEEGLEVARRHDGAIDLLLSDVVMPGVGGPALAAVVTRLRPETRVLFMSGYPGDSVAEHGLAVETDLLSKPFSPDTLLRRVADAVGRRRA